jgi:uncharacterized Ntn-hydrolase superfamily protein
MAPVRGDRARRQRLRWALLVLGPWLCACDEPGGVAVGVGLQSVLCARMMMAPELVTGGTSATSAADMYAFGVLACELLTGKRCSCAAAPATAQDFRGDRRDLTGRARNGRAQALAGRRRPVA